MAKAPAAAKKAPSKSEITNNIAEATGLSKKEVTAVMEALGNEIKKGLKSPGVFAIPGLVKIVWPRPRPATLCHCAVDPEARAFSFGAGKHGQRQIHPGEP